MAEKKRSESLQEQLDRLLAQSPKPYTAEEEAQIKKGRKGQADIDAGRATIEKRNEEVRKAQEQIDKLNEQIGKAIEFERGAAKEDAESAIAAKERAEKETLWGRGVQAASGLPAMKAGIFAGRALGKGANERADKGQEFKNTVLRQIADDRVKGLTTREGAQSGALRAGVLPSKNIIARSIPRGTSQMGLGVAGGLMGAYELSHVNPKDPWLTVAAESALGGAGVGAGLGLAEQGIERIFNPKVAPDGAALSIIDSPQIRRNGLNAAREIDKGPIGPAPDDARALPAPDEPEGPRPGGKDHLREQARALGVKVTTRMSKQEIADAMAAKLKEVGTKRVRGPRLPKGGGAAGIAGGLAYALTPDQAQAADGSQGGNQAQALTNAGIAGGAAYGASRGLDALGPIAKGVMAGASEGMAPTAIDAMTSYLPEEQQTANDWMVRNLPESMVPQGAAMAQLPSRNPARPTAGMFAPNQGDAEFQAALKAFLENYEADNGAPEGQMAEAY